MTGDVVPSLQGFSEASIQSYFAVAQIVNFAVYKAFLERNWGKSQMFEQYFLIESIFYLHGRPDKAKKPNFKTRMHKSVLFVITLSGVGK